ncbi:MAG: MgtC/SapB family protein [Clostridium sp.]|uniref:MgtC/SapB family protein n=1 Tax=Clostridium sp. TaxID=1506 RepID=UPI00290D945E|nr:MgtC/SapB family protein [Clostridium sp.]MDU5108835.1 MgtC/SapB family protein [Clostridium sp.]
MEKLYEINMISTFFRLLLALICGGILGIERGKKNRPAGFRTYMLVCVASAMVMITNQYIADIYSTGDPSRMGAQVISGIGFLGAGTIIVTGRNKVTGLTTAAGLWASACIGLTIGVGFYSGAIIGCVMIYIAMALLHGVDNRITLLTKEVTVYIEFASIKNLSAFLQYVKHHNMKVVELELIKSNELTETIVGGVFTLKLLEKTQYVDVIELLSKSEGVCSIEEI